MIQGPQYSVEFQCSPKPEVSNKQFFPGKIFFPDTSPIQSQANNSLWRQQHNNSNHPKKKSHVFTLKSQ